MRRALLLFLTLAVIPAATHATGHGPVYGIATPTLGKGAWSLDLGLMSRTVAGGRTSAMARPLISYGITEDLQASISLPILLYTLRVGQSLAEQRRGSASAKAG